MGEKLHSFSAFTASVCQLCPESRGSLRIKSADPTAPPEIRINYLATETDRRAFIDGLKILRKILAAPAMKSYRAGEVYPGSNVTSDEDLLGQHQRADDHDRREGIRYDPAGCPMTRELRSG
jgi:choline dehydrogenase